MVAPPEPSKGVLLFGGKLSDCTKCLRGYSLAGDLGSSRLQLHLSSSIPGVRMQEANSMEPITNYQEHLTKGFLVRIRPILKLATLLVQEQKGVS